MAAADDPVLPFASAAAWEAWLAAEGERADGIWIKMAKKATGIPTVTPDEAIDVALCHGWIDGQRRSLDEEFFLQRFTPRRARSKWSKVNREKVAALLEAGRMRPAGLREVERAQADGRWAAAYDPPSRATVPEDLQAALAADEAARTAFAGLDSRNRYAILFRLQDAKRPETRARRIETFVAMLARGEMPYPRS